MRVKKNMFSMNGLKIDYKRRMNTISERNDEKWISLSPTVLAVVVAIALVRLEAKDLSHTNSGLILN